MRLRLQTHPYSEPEPSPHAVDNDRLQTSPLEVHGARVVCGRPPVTATYVHDGSLVAEARGWLQELRSFFAVQGFV